MREAVARTGCREQSAKELWLCLFREQRAEHWAGGYGTSREKLVELDALSRALAAALHNATADERDELVPLFAGMTADRISRESIASDEPLVAMVN